MEIRNFLTITRETLKEFIESELSTLKESNSNYIEDRFNNHTKLVNDNNYFFVKSSEDKINEILNYVEDLEEHNRDDYNNALTEDNFKFTSNLMFEMLFGHYNDDKGLSVKLSLLYCLEFLENFKDNQYDKSNDLEIKEKTKLLFIAQMLTRVRELN